MSDLTLQFSELGESAILCQASSVVSVPKQRRLWTLREKCLAMDYVTDAICGVNTIMVSYEPGQISATEIRVRLSEAWDGCGENSSLAGRRIEIPVSYGGTAGPDLDAVAQQTHLTTRDVIRIHCESEYLVLAVGADPGFAYLSGLDNRLHVPRLSTPRLSAPSGSVIIAGAQAGVQPIAAPCGWNIIGQTSLEMFDVHRESPSTLLPGDMVRFFVQDTVE
ncbi:5-oxoprolinase subunit PxpB [Paraburkholderia caledonica]|uniref:KipI family sensor histidine kinase inhibitor n=1 Tax=Paraburkholderia caledonica TaxID=134536 RepID=A0AB73IPE1_9BURK|nr:KipI family sensor histidine kinase inhibitor [Paraburkholderia caledonica]